MSFSLSSFCVCVLIVGNGYIDKARQEEFTGAFKANLMDKSNRYVLVI